ncbi:MAG TPA: hypothetical protein VE258_14820, partial [Ktedonobacterales bacterium]|nr:hypothetical protein [Ktedonobacterales bacterium]
QALLFEGPAGIGKQRLALWLAQLLVCTTRADGADALHEPCGSCQPCRLVLGLSHPDVHWFVPLELSKKGADADRQVELVEEALAEEMAARRARPLYEPPSGLAIHGIAAVRLLLRRLALKPALGPRKVFVIGDAERLVPQTGTDAAANALLKALEEPPADTVFVLTTATPEALPPTILSRVVRVRVARLADSIVAAFAQRELGKDAQHDVQQVVTRAAGAPGRLLAEAERRVDHDAGGRFMSAVAAGRAQRYALALSQQPYQARGGFTAMLDGLLASLRQQARAGGDTDRLVRAISQVLDARTLARGNVNPQLVAAVLAGDLAGSERP